MSFVDAVGIRADGAVRVAECKATGPARRVYVETDGQQWATWWDNSLANLLRLWEQKPHWLPQIADLICVEYYLVGNAWFIDGAARHAAEARLCDEMRAVLPYGLKGKSEALIKPSIELLFEAVQSVRRDVVEEGWGKRYGDPILDALRELIRYTHPQPSGAGKVGTSIRNAVRQDLLRAVFGEEEP